MNKKISKSILIMVFSLLLFSNLAVALDDIPGDAPVNLPKSINNDITVKESSGLFSFLNSIFSIVTNKQTYDVNENIKITSTQTSWNLICEKPYIVIDIYQNGKKAMDSGAKLVSAINGNQVRTFNWEIGAGILDEGNYGAQSYLWCGDPIDVLCANNVYRGEGNICEADSKIISGFDTQDFYVNDPFNDCIPNANKEEICDDNIDNDCDRQIDEDPCTGDDTCAPYVTQKCYDNDVYYYDSCGVRQNEKANDCNANEQCINSGCQPIPNDNTDDTTPTTQPTTTISTNSPYIEDVNNCMESPWDCVKYNKDTGKVTGTFKLKNIGESMDIPWILEMQVVPKSQYEFAPMSFISLSSQKTCDANHPENVHKEFKLNKEESGTIILETTIPSQEDMKVWAIVVTKCGGEMKQNGQWISDYKDGGDVATLNYNVNDDTIIVGGCIEPFFDEDLKDPLFNPTQTELLNKQPCYQSSDCCKITDYKVGCLVRDDFEDEYGQLTSSWFQNIAINIFGPEKRGFCVAKKEGFKLDLDFLTEDSIIGGIANWIIFLAILLIFIVVAGRKK